MGTPNIISSRSGRGGPLNQSVDPNLARAVVPGSMYDQLAALMNAEARAPRRPAPYQAPPAAPRAAGYSGGGLADAAEQPQEMQVEDPLERQARRVALNKQLVLDQAASNPVPKKYVTVGGGSYLIDDWDAVPAAMRPNTQINTAGYTPKAQTSASDDLMKSMLESYAARQAKVGTESMETGYNRAQQEDAFAPVGGGQQENPTEKQRRQQGMNAYYGR